MFKSVGMQTVLLPMCPTDGPMAREARGDAPGNSLGQGSTSNTLIALQPMFGVLTYGARALYAAGVPPIRPSELAADVVWGPHTRSSCGFE